MVATLPPNYPKIQGDLSEALKKIGVDVSVEFDAKGGNGLKEGYRFIDNKSGKQLSSDQLTNLLDKATTGTDATASGKAAWVASFKEFVIENRTKNWFQNNHDVAIVSSETAAKAPFQQLLENAKSLDKLTPINWDLSSGKMDGVVKALDNIARMEGNDIQFQLDKTGKVTYSSNTLSKEDLSKKVTSMIESMVATDKSLVKPDGTLNDDGKQIAGKMDAYKSDRYYISFDKETGFEPSKLVDVVENAQIAIAAKSYLNFANVSVNDKPGYDKQEPKGVTHVEDGKDTYDFANNNLTHKSTKVLHGTLNEMAPIPNLTIKNPGNTIKVTGQSEEDMIKTLNTMRGALPIELSPDKAPAVKVLQTPKNPPEQEHNKHPAHRKSQAITV